MRHFTKACCAAFCVILTSCGAEVSAPAASGIVSLQDFMKQNDAIVINLEKLATGHEMLSVEINGEVGNFILDSGAGATVLHDEFVTKYGLQKDGATTTDQASGAGGKVDVRSYAISSFKIEGHSFELDRINTIDLASVVGGLKAAAGVDIDGVVGQDILTSYRGVIDVANSRLYLSGKKVGSEHGSK